MILPLSLALVALAAPADPQPLTAAEDQELQTTCKPLSDGLVDWARRQQGETPGKPEDILRTKGAELAPKMDPALRAHCASLFIQALQVYQQKVIEVEARSTLKSLATGLMSSYADKESLCPSADHPVPATLEQLTAGPYHSTAADWAGAGWQCAGGGFLAGEPQRFQYAFHSDPKAGTFELSAKGRSVAGGRIVEFVLRGKVEGGALKVGDVERH
jgi:hypothetical protein